MQGRLLKNRIQKKSSKINIRQITMAILFAFEVAETFWVSLPHVILITGYLLKLFIHDQVSLYLLHESFQAVNHLVCPSYLV